MWEKLVVDSARQTGLMGILCGRIKDLVATNYDNAYKIFIRFSNFVMIKTLSSSSRIGTFASINNYIDIPERMHLHL